VSDALRELHDRPAPDPAAEERAWRLVHAAFMRRPPAVAERTRARTLPALGGAVILALLLVFTPAGSAAIDAIRAVVAPAPRAVRAPAPARPLTDLRRLPGGGRLLVIRDESAYVAGAGREPRRLGPASEATFSAFGRYVAAAHRHTLNVYAIDGRRVWSVAEARPIGSVRWSPDGLRIAYRAGNRMRLIDGNGERAQTLGRADGAGMAWRPGPEPVLAYERSPGLIALTDVSTRRDVARLRAPGGTFTMSWADDGRRLVAAGPRELRVFDRAGTLVARRTPRAGRAFDAATFAPGTHRLALVVFRGANEALRFAGRTVTSAPRLSGPLFSPDGRWLLVTRGRQRWSFYPVGTPNATAWQARGAVDVSGWCCPTGR
jgi:hypothetical protein